MDDVRFALRQLRKNRSFAVTAVFALALGMGACLSIFAFVDAALLQPLPYAQPDRLVGVYERVEIFPRSNLSYLDYLDWKKLNTVFSSLAAYQGSDAVLTTESGAIRVSGARVSDDFLKTLGVVPAVGRDFRPGEDQPAAQKTVLLSYSAWQTRFGGRADILGRTVVVNGEPYVVIGVLPNGFTFAPVGAAEFWMPLRTTAPCESRRSCHDLYGVARLRSGVSIATAADNIKAIAAALESQYPDSNRGQGSNIVALADVIVGPVRPILMTLLGGAVLLLVIAVINVAGLLLVRAEARRREIAVRGALGASRWRIVRQFVAEGALLVIASSIIALAAAAAAIRLLRALVPAAMMSFLPFLRDAGLTSHVWIATAAIVVLSVLLFAFTPLARLSVSGDAHALAEGSRGSAGRAWSRVGSKLVAVELAFAMVLLAGGVLLARSLYGLLHVNLGMQPHHVAVIAVDVPPSYNGAARLNAVHERVLERVLALPGVESAGTTSVRPLDGGNTSWIRIDGRPYNGEHNEVDTREVDAGYFGTIGARMVKGRTILRTDDASAPRIVVINRALERTYFPHEDPIGRKMRFVSFQTDRPFEIVGVVDDIQENPLDAVAPPTMYFPFAQDPDDGFWLFVRTRQSEDSLLPTLASAIHALDPGLATFGGTTLPELVGNSEPAYLRRSGAWLVGAFAALAWLLGVVGLYGVIAYSVGRRTREIGVRMALGAQRGTVARLVLGEAGRLVAIGIALGAIAAVAAAMLARTLLFGVTPWDVPTLAIVAVVLGASALAASYLPARRAASLNPVEALRAE
ncbi:MAG TPA: ABC transporter permease [Vicinamibacterales bacterium]|jgi:macrolide transport system ATP-binding/permease protein|nr:ABC transporter permease [Vicinamibacterales bacterium]